MKLSAHVRATHNQDGAVILDILRGEMFRVNFVGSRMLELLKEGQTETQITEVLSKEFGVAREMIATDLQEFATQLQSHHLLELTQQENSSL